MYDSEAFRIRRILRMMQVLVGIFFFVTILFTGLALSLEHYGIIDMVSQHLLAGIAIGNMFATGCVVLLYLYTLQMLEQSSLAII
jgi:uncharacterized membrane protein